MLRQLSIRNYVLIDSLDISFPEGLVIITGQTGAGKSILLGALSLLLGSRADASSVGESGDNCVVEAEFELDPGDTRASSILEENDYDWNGGSLTIRRVVARSGRSRAFLNDEPVTLPVLAALSSRLVDIHSQHQTLLLSDRAFQLSMLDAYAGNAALLTSCSASWSELSALRKELAEVERRIAEAERDRDYNESLWKQLDAASLVDGELEELEAEQKTLANAEEIKELLQGCRRLSSTCDGDEPQPFTSNLKEIEKALAKLSRFIPSCGTLSGRLESCRLELEDIFGELEAADASVDVSPERLEFVDSRLSLLYSLLKKHSVQTVAGLIAVRESLSGNLADSTLLEERRERIKDEIDRVSGEYKDICGRLHGSRNKAAAKFAADIAGSLHFLELPSAVFEVGLADSAPGPHGTDAVTFLFSSTGRSPVDIAKCASGGELSRIMLCLKDMMARYSSMPTMVFDEIDTGVSGSVADRMGSMICAMGSRMQVFAITHLPQVAAKGDVHYLVSKHERDGRTVSEIEKLSAEQRVMEIARMLSGSQLTDAAVANARSLISSSERYSQDRR